MGQMISSGAADPSDARARFPIRWSEAALRTLHEEYEQVRHDTAEPRAALLSAQLKAAAGMFAEAESIVCDVLRADATRASAADNLEEVLWTLFVVQRFDLVCALLRQNASLTEHIEIIMEERNEDEFWQIEWQILSSTRAHFIFNKSIFKNDPAKMLFVRFVQIFPLFAQYMRRQPTETGSVTISLGDADLLDGLGFCTRLTQAFLIPDYFFIADRGYDALRGFFSEKAIPWGDRHPVALWRGGSTGDPNLPSHRWRELPRMRLCEIARSDAAKDSIDAGIYQISQISDPIHVNEITDAGYLKPYIPPHDFQKWKYQIDIDGNSNSWPGLFMKLLTGSVVLKVASERGFRQWYYDKLKPWTNYVPVSSDLSDLVELIDWLRAHDDVAREIGRQGRLLADSLDYQGELERAGDVITAAIRCSNARCRRAGPYFVTPHEVELAYRLILGRAPENQDVVFHYVATCRDLDHLRQPFLTSKEFREQRAVSV